MKLYLDTTVLIALLFGELSEVDQKRQPFVKQWLKVANTADDSTLFISIYTLQEL